MATVVRDNTSTALQGFKFPANADLGFTFTSLASAGMGVSSITFNLFDSSPGDGGSVTVKLYSVGASHTVGTLLATLGTIPDSGLGTTVNSTYTLSISTLAFTLDASTQYYIVLSTAGNASFGYTSSSTGTGITGEYSYDAFSGTNGGTPATLNDSGGAYRASLSEDLACYLRGTLIATGAGNRPIETLAIGDLVRTASGALRPVKWIGRRAYTGRFLAPGSDMMPVLFRAGALADNVPARDLYVSVQHAMLVDGMLLPAAALANGSSIVRLETVDAVEYFHIELDSHDVILAEGAPAETYMDCGNRAMFHNANEFHALHPHHAASRFAFCAERIEGGPRLEAARLRLARRAGVELPSDAIVPGPLAGYIDAAEWGRIAGWASDPANPGCPVRLEVLDGDAVIGAVLANQYRPDVKAAGINDGRCGFELTPLQLDPLVPHMIRVRRVADGAELHGSPAALDAAPAPDGAALAATARMMDAAAASPGPVLEAALEFLHAQAARLHQARADHAGRRNARQRPRRALFVDDQPPTPDRDAGSVAAVSHMHALQRLGYAVTFAAGPALPAPGPATDALEAEGIDCAAIRHRTPIEDVLRANAGLFDVVYLHRATPAFLYAPLVRHHLPAARLVYSVADLHHLRVARQAQAEGRPELLRESRRLAAAEAAAARMADAVLTHSAAEANILRREVPGARVHVVPWHVPAAPVAVPFAARSGLAFVASYGHAPNLDAAYWLVQEVMPLVWRHDPAIVCRLAGSAMPPGLGRLVRPGIEVLGHLPDLAPLYGGVRLTVAPLRFGAGVKGKVLQSLAAGLPCAMTPTAAEGIGLPPSLAWLQADDAEGLAAAIVLAHSDEAANAAAAAAGLHHIRAAWSEHQLDARLSAALGADLAIAV